MTAPALVAATVDAVKASHWTSRAVRHNPVLQAPLSRMTSAWDRSPARRAELRRRSVARALGWAVTTPYGRSLALRDPLDLGAWPILDKQELKADESRFHTARRLPTAGATTGGTSGVPLRLRRSVLSLNAEQFFLDRLLRPVGVSFAGSRFAVLRGDDIKDPSDGGPPYGRTDRGGRRLTLSAAHLNRATVAWYAEELDRFAPDFLWAYPSTLSALVRLFEQAGVEVAVPVVVTSSETLFPNEAGQAAEALGARVVDYYGQAERVALASNAGGDGYRFEPLYGAVELVEVPETDADDDGPEPGLAQASVIGTGLWNSAMPLVRYATGDLIWYRRTGDAEQLSRLALGHEPFVGIRGRRSDYLVTPEGGVVAGLNRLHRGVRGVLRMQLRQEAADTVEILVVPRGSRLEPDDRATVEANVAKALPRSMSVTVAPVDELPRTASGKTPYVVRADGLG